MLSSLKRFLISSSTNPAREKSRSASALVAGAVACLQYNFDKDGKRSELIFQ